MSTSSSDRSGDPSRQSDPAARPSRRVFSPEYKLAIVAEYENAPNGEKGAILRREGLYSSHVIEWTRARDAGVFSAGSAGGAGWAAPKRSKKTAEQLELEKLRRENEKLKSDLGKTRMALDIMGKAHALLEDLSESAGSDEPPRTS
ncbi:transposase [Saccharopolyspora phatthalungensis]|uniref:Transposase-like protein n=1 Tax=Saccharopolyspora phatthalungensis TaxID=664693 RepID=A0A840QJF3_9PSEU|nr:transposase [Saccharopolyspora phatthalungensis]MBB5159298.1 transposase-like protein [Saccharopolyspora phatthalungensis]